MKKFLLVILLGASLSTMSAQSLANTYWADYDSTNNFGMYWNFTNDSVKLSFDLITWDPIASYTYTPNIYRMVDDPSLGCGNPMDTGVYATSFSADTLWLIPIYDSCSERLEYISSVYLLSISLGINEESALQDFEMYPNPSNGNVTISSSAQSVPREIIVTDMSGRVVHREMNTTNTSLVVLDLQTLPAGTYLVSCDFGDHTSTKRIVRL
ncbi:MAG TPA: T9SS type A sorting domain-containing protein [Bacteroidia bacterium]|nr:T9SS type A sorting domain-containing protein [Bacteroidia bacterium]